MGPSLYGVGVDDIGRDLIGDDAAPGDGGAATTLLIASEFLIIDLKPYLDHRRPPGFLPMPFP